MDINLPMPIVSAINALEDEGYRAFIAGSCVRELLLGNTPVDYDVITNAGVSDIEYVFRDFRLSKLNVQRGEILVIIKGYTILVTPYRASVVGDSVVYTDDILADLRRRGFTINSMAYNPRKGLIDSFFGKESIIEKSAVVQVISRTKAQGMMIFEQDTFSKSPINILKALRYISENAFTIDEKTLALIKENKELIKLISSNDIKAELDRIICGKNVLNVFEIFAFILTEIIVDINKMIGIDKVGNCDLYTRVSRAISSVPPILEVRYALLFRYSGVYDCISCDYKGNKHYFGMKERSRLIARSSLNSLGYSNNFIDSVDTLIDAMDVSLKHDRIHIKRLMAKYGHEMTKWLCYCAYGEGKGMNNNKLKDCARKCLDEIDDILAKKECYDIPMLAINAIDLVRERIVNKISASNLLSALLNVVLEHPGMNTKIILLEMARKIVEENRKNKVKR